MAPKSHAERMRLVRDDCEPDAKALDGMPLNGRAVGNVIGQVLAMVEAIADTVALLCERLEEDSE